MNNKDTTYTNRDIDMNRDRDRIIPHRGSLHRIHMDIDNSDTSTSYNQPTAFIYAISIHSPFYNNDDNIIIHQQQQQQQQKYQLQFHPEHYKFLNDIFNVLDVDCKGYITKRQLQEFVLLRCPVFKRRDDVLVLFDGEDNSEYNSEDGEGESEGYNSSERRGCNVPMEENDLGVGIGVGVGRSVHSEREEWEEEKDDTMNTNNDNHNFNDNCAMFQNDHDETKDFGNEQELEHKNNDIQGQVHENENESECQEYELKNSILETQNERDIFNCILGEEYQSAEQDCYFYDNTIITPTTPIPTHLDNHGHNHDYDNNNNNEIDNNNNNEERNATERENTTCGNDNDNGADDENSITHSTASIDHHHNDDNNTNNNDNDVTNENTQNTYPDSNYNHQVNELDMGHHYNNNHYTHQVQDTTPASTVTTTEITTNSIAKTASKKMKRNTNIMSTKTKPKAESQTFEEVWTAVVQCSSTLTLNEEENNHNYNNNHCNDLVEEKDCLSPTTFFGIEAWMVFCRFISLAQYQDAKRRFSARHLQQAMPQKTATTATMNNYNHNYNHNKGGMNSYIGSGSGSSTENEHGGFSELNSSSSNEVILVDVPPLERPVPITAQHLIEYEVLTLKKSDGSSETVGIALPELDLDHSHLLLHDSGSITCDRGIRNSGARRNVKDRQSVQMTVFGHNISSSLPSYSTDDLDFVIRLMSPRTPIKEEQEQQQRKTSISVDQSVVVRRSFSDMSWLHDTFTSQKQLGGTLCGRILPPFPSPLGGGSGPYSSSLSNSDFFDKEEKRISSASSSSGVIVGVSGGSSASSTAISVASASAVMVTSAAKSAKSFLGRLSSSTSSTLKAAGVTSSSSISSTSKKIFPSPTSSIPYSIKSTTKSTNSSSSMEKGSNKIVTPKRHGNTNRRKYSAFKDSLLDNPTSKAKQLERYINYMLDHPAMSTSFPLNVMLKASQSGVESAKRILVNPMHSTRDVNQLIQNGSAIETARYNFEKYGLSGGNLSWVRTAAQAALALKLHGILETTGYQSVSAKLQHASLPKFSKVGTFATGDEERATHGEVHQKKKRQEDMHDSEDDFEKEIVCVKSNLDEEAYYEDNGRGYDMLPSPLPLPERSALCAGSVQSKALTADVLVSSCQSIYNVPKVTNQSRVRYSDASRNDEASALLLGDVAVDRDIDRLRDMIRTVDASLGKCLSTGLCFGAETCEKTTIQLALLKEIDNGEGWRGKMIGQRALLKGVDYLEMTCEASLASTESFVSDISWNASLASSAVTAADEVRDAVKASRTAARAKNAAEIAAKKADHFCHTATFTTPEEARNAQVRASKLRSQAIHSAVVEYEAVTAKRQAAVALARDVKCWNIHRKQQLVRTCLDIVRSQKKITNDTVSAWEGLRDGLQESSPISNIVHSSVKAYEVVRPLANVNIEPSASQQYGVESFHNSFQESKEDTVSSIPSMTPSFHQTIDYGHSPQTPDTESSFDKNFDIVSPSTTEEGSGNITSNNALMLQSPDFEGSFHDTFEENIPVEDGSLKLEPEIRPDIQNDLSSGNIATKLAKHNHDTKDIEIEPENTKEIERDESENCLTNVSEPTYQPPDDDIDAEGFRLNHQILANEGAVSYSNIASVEVSSDDGMTDSMQSLVDGLMNWGGQWDEEEDLAPLPQGMAASMLEERGVLDLQ